jgi:hypothetical protein
MRAFLVIAGAVALAALTYLWLERLGRRGLVPLACRALAWSALGLLLINLGCPARDPPGRPLILLDGSLSMGAAGGRWAEARGTAARLGEVREFGDEGTTAPDSAPTRGRSRLGPALTAAAAAGRPVVVVTDGEVDDAGQVPADLLARTGVLLFERKSTPDVAITEVLGPARVATGDSVVVAVEIRALAGAVTESVTVTLEDGDRRLVSRVARLGPSRSARIRLRTSASGLSPGEHILRVRIDPGDADPRTDVRLHPVTVLPTPGIVLVAAPADWDSRFLYRALKDVADLPVRGFARLGDRWRSLRDLSVASDEQVRQAVRRADLLILKGAPAAGAEGARARGIWRWPSGEAEDGAAVQGDWYVQAGTGSPLDAAFAGAPLDSFPPSIQLVTRRAGEGEWVALAARNGRRGPEWPAVVGREAGRVREVSVLADGLWRWAFRGAAAEQTYRAWVAATVSWLLAGADSAQGVARPFRPVVQQGLPLVFEWIGGGAPQPTPVRWSGAPAGTADTLRFDGAGRAEVRLPPGTYRYRLEPSGSGTVAVEVYSDEFLPRAATLGSRTASAGGTRSQRSSRDLPWLFLAALLGLTGEWVARRRMGLR